MDAKTTDIRKQIIDKILAEQDDLFRWGFDEKRAREQPNFLYYTPNYKSTLWTLLMLADLKAPADIKQIVSSIQLITERFYDPEHGIFRLPGMTHFPIPCLNGNMIYLHNYFEISDSEIIDKTIKFFDRYQRFDDGDYSTPKSYPYCKNKSCYGKHSCYWGITKLLKGISFIPRSKRSKEAKQLIEKCIAFVLLHDVCFSSHDKDRFLHREIGKLTFPNSWKSDYLEILWLLVKEEVQDERIARALELLRSKMKDGRVWELEKSMNFIVSTGKKTHPNAFITERAIEVLNYYEY